MVTYRNKVPPPGVEPGHVTHPITNRARRRVTSLIRLTPLPLRHAAALYEKPHFELAVGTLSDVERHRRSRERVIFYKPYDNTILLTYFLLMD